MFSRLQKILSGHDVISEIALKGGAPATSHTGDGSVVKDIVHSFQERRKVQACQVALYKHAMWMATDLPQVEQFLKQGG